MARCLCCKMDIVDVKTAFFFELGTEQRIFCNPDCAIETIEKLLDEEESICDYLREQGRKLIKEIERMDEKEKKMFYKPKVMTQEDMQRGFKQATQQRGDSQQGMPNYWRTQSMKQTRQTSLDEYGLQAKAREQPQDQHQEVQEQQEEEPRWSAEEWEAWALSLLTTYYGEEMTPEQMLPSWFVERHEVHRE